MGRNKDLGASPLATGLSQAEPKVSALRASIPSALDFDLAFDAAAKPERELALGWILLGVDRKGEPVVLDADSGFFEVDLLPEFWACDNGIEYPHDLGAGLYLMTEVVIRPDSCGDPTFKGKIEPLATVFDALARIDARSGETACGIDPKDESRNSSETQPTIAAKFVR